VHVGRSYKLALFDIDGTIGLAGDAAGGDEKVGLATEKCGNLKQIYGFGNTRAVFSGVDVGEDGEVMLLSDGSEDAGAFDDSRTAEAVDRGAVSLIVAGLEDVWDAKVGGDALDRIGHHAGMLFGFDNARAGDEEEFSATYGDVADLEGMVGCVAHKDYLTTAKERLKSFGASLNKLHLQP
jgi:hypothetical protein